MKKGLKELAKLKGTPAERRMDRGGERPDLTKGIANSLTNILEVASPAGDMKSMVDEAKRAEEAVKKGNYLEAIGAAGLAAAAPAFVALPSNPTAIRKGAAKLTGKGQSPLRKLFDELPEDTKKALPEQPSDTGLWGYHGSAKGRLEKEGEPYFDIGFGNPNDQFIGEGFYFTINPKVAEEYANLRAAAPDFNQKMPDSWSKERRLGDSAFRDPNTNRKATTETMMEGKDLEGTAIEAGQNLARFDLKNIKKPYVIGNEKQRKWAKDNIETLKEEGYDSILFRDFDDRSQQILVFPEHIGKISQSSGQTKKVVSNIAENLPEYKKGLKSLELDEKLYKNVLKTSEGNPVIIYRGSNVPPDNKKATEDILKGKGRPDYATFASDNPNISETYIGKDEALDTGGVMTPFMLKPKKLIEYEDRFTRQNAIEPNSASLDFDIFEFDRQAQKLKKGEVLVVRDVRDSGAQGTLEGPALEKGYASYGGDIYAIKDESVLVSPITKKKRGGSVIERNPYADYKPRSI